MPKKSNFIHACTYHAASLRIIYCTILSMMVRNDIACKEFLPVIQFEDVLELLTKAMSYQKLLLTALWYGAGMTTRHDFSYRPYPH